MEDGTRATLARRRRLIYGLSLAIQLALAPFLIHDWDGFVFDRAASDFAAGVTPYALAEAAPFHIFLEDVWPPVNSWYAYPPLALLLFTPLHALAAALTPEPFAARLALKVPFILGNLALAFVAGLLVRDVFQGGAEERERRRALAERFVLLNPFLIVIGAIWGMFDAIVMALLLASVVLIGRRQPTWGGVAFGAAALVKVFPLFVSPLVAYYVWSRFSTRAAARYVAAAVGTFTLVSLPFLLEAPRGFVQQTLVMHSVRPPQGLALVSGPLHLDYLNKLFGWSLPVMDAALIGAVSLVLVGLLVALVHVRAPTARDTRSLLHLMLATLLGLLLVSKVVNEQYLVMPIALLVVLAALDASAAGRYRRALRAFSIGAFVSSIFLGFHFITFLPPDVAAAIGAPRPTDLVHAVALATGLPLFIVFAIPHLVALVALIPAAVHAVRIVAPVLRDATRDVHEAMARAGRPVLRERARPTAVAMLVLLLGAALAPGVVLSERAEASPAALPPLPERVVAYRYDLTLANPSHDPALRDGTWRDPALPRPDDGYYSATIGKVARDLETIRSLGGDVLIVGQDGGNRIRMATLLDAAAAKGLRAAPELDLHHLRDCPAAQFQPLAALPPGRTAPPPDSAELLARCAADALAEFADHPAALRLEEKPVLFLRNAPMDAWVGAALLEAVPDARLVAGHQQAPAPAWAGAHYLQGPDAGEAQQAMQAYEEAVANGAPIAVEVFGSTPAIPGTLGGESTMERTWRLADGSDATMVVLSWNRYREGSHVEPASDGGWLAQAAAGARSWRNPAVS